MYLQLCWIGAGLRPGASKAWQEARDLGQDQVGMLHEGQ